MAFTSLGDIFFQWESLGVYDFVLPFLLVFALVFGILTTTKVMGKNKAVTIIIALVIGLMSLRYQYFFSDFISQLFPRVGIGIAILLTLLIFVGLFINEKEQKYWGYGLAAVGALIAIVILHQTGESLGWFWTGNSDNIGFVVLAILLVGIIIAVASSGSDNRGRSSNDGSSKWGLHRINDD